GDGELRRDLDRRRIAAEFRGAALDQGDTFFHFMQGTPAAKPTLTIFRHPLKRLEIMAANIERERLGKALWCQLQILIAVILAGEAATLLGEELVQDLQPLI